MLLRPAWSHWDIWENTELRLFPLVPEKTILRHAQVNPMRNAADCPKVLRFHVSMRKEAMGFENCTLKCPSKSVGENRISFRK